MCEQLGNLKNSVYPLLVTLSLLSPTSSASGLRMYYNKMVRAKETPQLITPAPPPSRSFPSTSTPPPNTHPYHNIVPILEYFEEMQDAENLAYLLSRLRLLHNASYLKAPSLTAILARINPLVREFSSSLFRLSMLERG